MRDIDIFQAIQRWLDQSETVWLCTVLDAWGSSPRPRGSLLACNARGEFIGSLSGGCVEEDLIARIVAGEFPYAVSRYRYGATNEEAERFQLPCGGILDIAIEKLQPSSTLQNVITSIVEVLASRRRIAAQRIFATEEFSVTDPDEKQPALHVIEDAAGNICEIQHVLGPQYRLLLIGISDVSRAVAQLALFLDYEIFVCDPRAEARARWDIAGVTLLSQLPDDAVREYGDDVQCAILALTHDPRIDDMALMEAFNTKAFYIGAMGSLRTSKNRRDRLQQLDVTAEQLQRLHAPIGLDTGSKTPMEIAVSVLAQLTAVRARKTV
ncbi:MAG TPA: XdhC family protein [Pseudomonadales bacterium]|nr:XdhC family protein [Pseudomonadales bacterium]